MSFFRLDEILAAEKLRDNGLYQQAIEKLAPFGWDLSFDIASLKKSPILFLMTLRIYWGALFSLAKRSKNPWLMAQRLAKCSEILTTYYENTDVKAAAALYTTDAMENPYYFHDEMERDMFRYYLFVLKLRGAKPYFVVEMLEGISLKVLDVKEVTLRTLWHFEIAIEMCRLSQIPISFLFTIYREAYEASYSAKNFSRAATIWADVKALLNAYGYLEYDGELSFDKKNLELKGVDMRGYLKSASNAIFFQTTVLPIYRLCLKTTPWLIDISHLGFVDW